MPVVFFCRIYLVLTSVLTFNHPSRDVERLSTGKESVLVNEINVVDRFLAIVLMAGGVLGAGSSVYGQGRILYQSSPTLLRTHWMALVPMELFLGLFLWSAIVGVRYWRQEARAWKWAAILFAVQIPITIVPGLRYEYFTGIAVPLTIVHFRNSLSIGFSFGSRAAMWVGPGIPDLIYGVNLFACVAVLYLFMRRASYKQVTAPA